MIQKIAFIATKANENKELKQVMVQMVTREYSKNEWNILTVDNYLDNISQDNKANFDDFIAFMKNHINYEARNDKAFYISYNANMSWHRLTYWFRLHSTQKQYWHLNNFFHYPPIDIMSVVLQHYLRIGIKPRSMKLTEVLESIHLKPEKDDMQFIAYEIVSTRKIAKVFGLVDTL